jgi:D-psicose/D-tagatose/L-ribulose 3-epimerase
MKLGMNMLLWSTDVSGSEYDAVFAMLKDAGYDGVEIPIFDREIYKYAALGRRLKTWGLEAPPCRHAAPTRDPIAARSGVRAGALAATVKANPSRPPRSVPRRSRAARRPARSLPSGAAPTVEEKARAVAYLEVVAPQTCIRVRRHDRARVPGTASRRRISRTRLQTSLRSCAR